VEDAVFARNIQIGDWGFLIGE